MHRSMLLLLLGAIVIGLAIVYAMVFGTFIEEARAVLPLPWFQVTIVDLYLGFFLFGGWIFCRESSRPRALGWLVLLCLLGNLAACIYAILAMRNSQGDWSRFWMGQRAATG